MLEFQEKKKLKRFIYSRLTVSLLLIVLFFLLKGVWNVYGKQQITRENYEETRVKLEALRARETKLSKDIEKLKTDEGVEQEIRDRYGLVKPGEEIIVIVDKSRENREDRLIYPEESFWQKIINWFR